MTASPEPPVVPDEVERTARILIAAWEKAEGRPVHVAYVATFADMARAIVAANPPKPETIPCLADQPHEPHWFDVNNPEDPIRCPGITAEERPGWEPPKPADDLVDAIEQGLDFYGTWVDAGPGEVARKAAPAVQSWVDAQVAAALRDTPSLEDVSTIHHAISDGGLYLKADERAAFERISAALAAESRPSGHDTPEEESRG